MNCSRDDIVLLPIPFTDLSSRKVRPAIVIGFGSHPGDLFLVPLTSQLSNADFPLADWQAAGLNVSSGIKAQNRHGGVIACSKNCRPSHKSGPHDC
jgi:mRNA interferase MazF